MDSRISGEIIMKTPNFTENDFIVPSQDAISKLVESLDGDDFKNLIIHQLKTRKITHNQHCFLFDACANLVK